MMKRPSTDRGGFGHCVCRLRHGFAAALVLAGGCSEPPRNASRPVIDSSLAAVSVVPSPEAQACAGCHPGEVEQWQSSQHAHANRLVSAALDGDAFAGGKKLVHGDAVTTMRAEPDRFLFTYSFSNEPPQTYRAEAVIGISPLRQYLVTFPGGRLQTIDAAYDPRSHEWFHSFPDARVPGDWGHWKGRSMTWNVQCAFCHMTGFEKRYDVEKDAYHSTWKQMGISCSQCHALREVPGFDAQVSGTTNACPMVEPSNPEHRTPDAKNSAVMDNCASCHARREELFGTFKPGDRFDDHFRLSLPDQPATFHADGQVLDEDFEYASFMMSRMGHQGVTCLNCHDAHSGKTILPFENNALCMQCHVPPGLNGATPIDPLAHQFHEPGTPGGRCVDCHMPENRYMVRDLRRDHGFTSPDPRLTMEWGIPNACNRCHADQTPQWANEWTETWYGEKMNRRARTRARAVAAYHAGATEAGTNLLALAKTEEIDAWRAALVGMLGSWGALPDVQTFLLEQLAHPHPRVRSAAVAALANVPGHSERLAAMRADPSALVRVDATLATLSPSLSAKSRAEVFAYLQNISDQPAGALRQAQTALQEGRTNDVIPWTANLVAWDVSAQSFYMAGRLQHAAGHIVPAVSNLAAAARIDTNSAEFSHALALALAEAGNEPIALAWLEETVRRDPRFGRAWYNLGLAYAAQERLPEAIRSLRRAEKHLPHSGDPSYALATVHLRSGDPASARSAVQAALQREPEHQASRALLEHMNQRAR
jgi:predicted CXXCH cytochrome family protein